MKKISEYERPTLGESVGLLWLVKCIIKKGGENYIGFGNLCAYNKVHS